MFIGDHDEFLEFSRLSVKAVESPYENTINRSILEISKQPLIFRTRLTGRESRAVVVDVDASHLPMSTGGLLAAVVLLAVDPETFSRWVM
jgi:hypothetical protein